MAVEPCRVTRSGVDGVAVVEAAGEFDIAAADDLRRAVETASADIGARVVVDLSGVTFLDSSCIGVLVAAGRNAVVAGGWLRILKPRDNVRRVLSMTQVDQLLGAYDDLDEAINTPSGSWA